MWLDPVRAVLENTPDKINVFFRDDDAGWSDENLGVLLDVFSGAQVPIDLAVIPKALTFNLAKSLNTRMKNQPLGVHQHGYAHSNHETTGRKCEFGPGRPVESQYKDIREGMQHMRGHFGDTHDLIFTPPWNRCTEATACAVRMLGFSALSRDMSAEKFPAAGLQELPISVDWCRHSAQPGELGNSLANALRQKGPVGIMLHHAVMTDEDMNAVSTLLALMKHSKNVEFNRMASCLTHPPAPKST